MHDVANHRTRDTGQVSNDERFLNAREAALLLGVSERTIRRAIHHGTLSATKSAGIFRIRQDDLDRYRERRVSRRQDSLPSPPPFLTMRHSQHQHSTLSPRFPLIGREDDLQAVENLLAGPDVALVTILGSGGVGKTRLALEVSARVRDAFPDGVWFIDLATVRDPDLVPALIVGRLGLQEAAGVTALDRLSAFLESRTALLVLDNFEHVAKAARHLPGILSVAPNTKVLATSRVPLNVSEEHRFPLAPLALPIHHGTETGVPEHVSPSVELFCRKARLVQPGFSLTRGNVSAVEGICTRLDGLPLAIELAAARVNVLPPKQMLLRLDQSLSLLSGGPQDAPHRLRSMRDAIAWSYDLLTPGEQQLFRRLAVFTGGFTEEAAASICREATNDHRDVFNVLSCLVENSLLTVKDEDDTLRFSMLETVREFGLEQLGRRGELATTRNRHAAWSLELARKSSDHWFTARQGEWSAILAKEHANLHTALQWLEDCRDGARVVELSGLIWPYWFVRSHWSIGVTWLSRALAWSKIDRTVDRVRLLTGAACLWFLQDDEPRSTAFGEEALSLVEETGPVSPTHSPLNGLAITAIVRGDHAMAERFNQRALRTFRAQADEHPSALPLMSVILSNVARSAFFDGDIGRATALAREALDIQEPIGFTWGASNSLLLLARIAHKEGEAERATCLFRKSLLLAADHRDLLQLLELIDTFVVIEHQAGNNLNAATFMGGSDRLRELLGIPDSPDLEAHHERITREALFHLAPENFRTARETGRRLEVDDLITLGLEIVVPPVSSSSRTILPNGLTGREMEVLCLLAEGWTDQEIADRLFISRRTVNTHVSRLLAKLDVPSRRQAMALARSNDLLQHCPLDANHASA
jgi:excisionase family DNA binding protein